MTSVESDQIALPFMVFFTEGCERIYFWALKDTLLALKLKLRSERSMIILMNASTNRMNV